MPVVRSTFRGDRNLRPRGAAFVGIVVGRRDPEFFHGVGVQADDGGKSVAVHLVVGVNTVYHDIALVAVRAVDGPAPRINAQVAGVLHVFRISQINDARLEGIKPRHVAAEQRQLLDLVRANRLAHRSVAGIEQRGLRRDFDNLR